MNKQQYVHIGNSARNKTYEEVIEKISEDAVCPFCPENLQKYHKPPILKTGEHWIVSNNMYPYENTKHHFVFITHKHITDTKDLTDEMWIELQKMLNWLIEAFDIDSGTFFMRSGTMGKSGATVQHLHAQFVVGADPSKPVTARVG